MTLDIRKALDESESAGVGGGVLIPEKISPDIRDILDISAPIRVLLNRFTWDTNSYEWDDRTALMYGGFYAKGDKFNEYGGVNKSAQEQSTYQRRNSLVRRIKSEGNVDNLLRAAGASFTNVLDTEVKAATTKMRLVEEDAILRATTPTNGFDPLYIQITQNVDAVGAIMSFDLLDTLIDTVEAQGFPVNLLIMAHRDLGKLRKEARTLGKVSLDVLGKKGIESRIFVYNGVKIVTSSKVPKNLTYGGTPTNGMSVCYAVNTEMVHVPVLEDVTYEEVAVTTDSLAFRLKEYITLAVIGGSIAHAKLINIAGS